MSKVAIVADSTANLPPELIEKYNVTVVPLSVIWGDRTYLDNVDLTPDEFYTRLQKSKVSPTTSQPSPNLFLKAFSPLLDRGYDVLCITISSKLSGTMQSAIQARDLIQQPGRVDLFDSETASTATGFQVIAAARAAAMGGNLQTCKEAANKARQNSSILFMVDNLEYLHRGGRINSAARFLGTAFNLKPLLEVRNGVIEAVERVRSPRKALDRMLDLTEQRLRPCKTLRMTVLDAHAPEYHQYLKDQCLLRFKPDEIIEGVVTPVIGTHTGPGTAGIGFHLEF